MDDDFSDIVSAPFKDEPAPHFDDGSETYLQFLEANGARNVDPMSAEGLALQARYVQSLADNKHPLDVLRKIALNPFASPRDRISATKTMMEYSMLKAPSKVEVTDTSAGRIKLDPSKFSALSTEELNVLLTLLEKLNTVA